MDKKSFLLYVMLLLLAFIDPLNAQGRYAGGIDDGFAMVQASTSTLSLTELESQKTITVFPNPVQDYLCVRLKRGNMSQEELNISIIDLTGNHIKVFQNKVDDQQSCIDIRNLSVGTYLVKIQVDGKDRDVYKIIKQ